MKAPLLVVRWLLVVAIVTTWSIGSTSTQAALAPTPPTPHRSGGPDAGGYAFIDDLDAGGPAYNWTEIASAGGVLVPTTDSSAANVTMPFPFTYYSTAVTSLRIGNNGAVRVNDTTNFINDTNYAMSDASNTPDNFIAPYWDDMGSPSPPAGVYTATLGVAPNRTFIIEWSNVPAFGISGTNNGSWQLVLVRAALTS